MQNYILIPTFGAAYAGAMGKSMGATAASAKAKRRKKKKKRNSIQQSRNYPKTMTTDNKAYKVKCFMETKQINSAVWCLQTILASGVMLSLFAASAVIKTRAAAPSFSVLALAAVTVPKFK